jgi:hypothetical protein
VRSEPDDAPLFRELDDGAHVAFPRRWDTSGATCAKPNRRPN